MTTNDAQDAGARLHHVTLVEVVLLVAIIAGLIWAFLLLRPRLAKAPWERERDRDALKCLARAGHVDYVLAEFRKTDRNLGNGTTGGAGPFDMPMAIMFEKGLLSDDQLTSLLRDVLSYELIPKEKGQPHSRCLIYARCGLGPNTLKAFSKYQDETACRWTVRLTDRVTGKQWDYSTRALSMTHVLGSTMADLDRDWWALPPDKPYERPPWLSPDRGRNESELTAHWVVRNPATGNRLDIAIPIGKH